MADSKQATCGRDQCIHSQLESALMAKYVSTCKESDSRGYVALNVHTESRHTAKDKDKEAEQGKPKHLTTINVQLLQMYLHF